MINLAQIATKMMLAKGLIPEFSQEEMEELDQIQKQVKPKLHAMDLRFLLWCSIDNDDSRDLDQLTYAEKGIDNTTTLWVAVADVDALVQKGSKLDAHAHINTTSVYTPAKIFPMLPEKLSTDLTSLNENEDRAAIVVKIQLNEAAEIQDASFFQAIVHNYAKLAYSSLGAWLEGSAQAPEKIGLVEGLENTLQIQHQIAQALRKKRHESGALTLESSEPEAKIGSNRLISIQPALNNFANQLIEEFMIIANKSMAENFKRQKITSLRRVVRIPKYWNQIVELAKNLGEELPGKPDSKALDAFLIKRKTSDPKTFQDLSLSVIKLLGRGEYVVENENADSIGHFALALTDYMHSTAPNRRFPDLISQRQCKASLQNEPPPYSLAELEELAAHCTEQEDAATKVERQMNKCAAAQSLSDKIFQTFQGIVTGVSDKGTWIRIFTPPVEGKIVQGSQTLKVGDLIQVRLKHVDIEKGFIDFEYHPKPYSAQEH